MCFVARKHVVLCRVNLETFFKVRGTFFVPLDMPDAPADKTACALINRVICIRRQTGSQIE